MATVIQKEYKVLVKYYLVIVAKYNPYMYYQEKLQAAKIFAIEDLKMKYPDIEISL